MNKVEFSRAAKVPFAKRYDNYIGGQWVAPKAGRYFENISPVTGRPLGEVARSDAADIEAAHRNERYAIRHSPSLAFVDQGDPQPRRHQGEHFGFVLRLVDDVDRDAGLEQPSVQLVIVSRALAPVEGNQRLAGELRYGHRLLGGELRACLDRQQHGVAGDGLHGQGGVDRRIVEKAGIDAPVINGVDLVEAGHGAEHQPHARVGAAELHDRLRDDAVPRRYLDEAELQHARLTTGDGLGLADRMVEVQQDLAAMLAEGPTRRRQLHAARQPVEQRHAEFGLEQLYLPAQRRLGDVDALRRAAEMLVLGYRDEISNLSQIHVD